MFYVPIELFCLEFKATKKGQGNMFMKPCGSLDNRAKDNTTGPVFLHCIKCKNRKYLVVFETIDKDDERRGKSIYFNTLFNKNISKYSF